MAHPQPEDIFYESTHFIVERSPRPLISREEGGHIRIFARDPHVSCINDLNPGEAVELIRLESVVRQAFIHAMAKRGIELVWVNIEDLGNWAFKAQERPRLHIHIFGRVQTAVKQKWPEAPYLPDRSSGFYEGFQPLQDEDITLIRQHIELALAGAPYTDPIWNHE